MPADESAQQCVDGPSESGDVMKQVFLGGSCDPTTWRTDVAIPALTAAGVEFYNPQVADWRPELMELEATAKSDSDVLLFVVDGQTRAIASILEATEYTVAGRNVVLVINNIPDGTIIDGEAITGRQLKDLNRARSYLRDLVGRHSNATVFETVDAAVDACAQALVA